MDLQFGFAEMKDATLIDSPVAWTTKTNISVVKI